MRLSWHQLGSDTAVGHSAANATQGLVEGNGRRFLSRFFSTSVDVSDEAQVNAFAAELRDAGIVHFADIDDVTFERWSQTFADTMNGAFLLVRARRIPSETEQRLPATAEQ